MKQRMGGRNPLGQFVSFGSASCANCSAEIVGVSGNAMVGRDVTDEFRPVVYVPYTMNVWGGLRDMYYELRTAGHLMALAGMVRELVREADPRLPVSDMQTQSAVIDGTYEPRSNLRPVVQRLCGIGASDRLRRVGRVDVVQRGAAYGRNRNPRGPG